MEELLGLLVKPISDVLLRIIPDQNQRDALNAQIQLAILSNAGQLQTMIAAAAKAQADVNLAEAQNASMFVAGWRPFVGWICGCGCLVAFLIYPLTVWICTWLKVPPPPSLDVAQLMTLLLGMLGMGGLRTYEKVSGMPDSTPFLARKK